MRDEEWFLTTIVCRITFLKTLKRAGLSTDDLLYFYTSVIRPNLEYVCYVWHRGLTWVQTDILEAVQKRSLGIIFRDLFFGIPYLTALQTSVLGSQHTRITHLSKSVFQNMWNPSNITIISSPKTWWRIINQTPPPTCLSDACHSKQ